MHALAAEPVQVLLPGSHTSPFVFASPHSGRFYPSSFANTTRLDPVTLRKSEDAFVDELFGGVTGLGAPLVLARFPRA
ncbi:MAG TPA: N-formylglutamate amidohydrolase, partial [Candidatus Polarisedimenticolia bacterium]|nr:N-formylglutamate amidohydrolase [Candidatus Polarisedimenticolia bacterium]